MNTQKLYDVKRTDVPTLAPWVVYAQTDANPRAAACCFTEADAMRVMHALRLVDAVEQGQLGLATQVDGVWRVLSAQNSATTINELADDEAASGQ